MPRPRIDEDVPRPSAQPVACLPCPARDPARHGTRPRDHNRSTHHHILTRRCRHAMRLIRFLLCFLQTTRLRRQVTTHTPQRQKHERSRARRILDQDHDTRPRDDHESELQEWQLRGNEGTSKSRQQQLQQPSFFFSSFFFEPDLSAILETTETLRSGHFFRLQLWVKHKMHSSPYAHGRKKKEASHHGPALRGDPYRAAGVCRPTFAYRPLGPDR